MKSNILIFLIALAAAPVAHAWDNEGHMMVAAIAYDKLDAPVQKKVDALIKLNPNYKSWVKGVAAKEQGKTAFVMAATWPDFIKEDGKHKSDGPNGGDVPPAGPTSSQNLGYTDKLMHKYWHFYDTPFSDDGTLTLPPKNPNAQTQIAAFRKVLADPKASPKLKSYDLVWLEHLTGDVHQPLHATTRFTSDAPKGDAGGNDVKLKCTGCPEELHAYWDDVLGTSRDPAVAAAAASKLPAAPAADAAIADETKWIDESFQATKKSVYVTPIGKGTAGPYALTPAYEAAAKKLAEARVELAGARLANLLNAALK